MRGKMRVYQPPRRLSGTIAMLNINSASAGEIDAVPRLKGHGFEIVRYREERGGFDALRQLEEVPGLSGKASGLETIILFG